MSDFIEKRLWERIHLAFLYRGYTSVTAAAVQTDAVTLIIMVIINRLKEHRSDNCGAPTRTATAAAQSDFITWSNDE